MIVWKNLRVSRGLSLIYLDVNLEERTLFFLGDFDDGGVGLFVAMAKLGKLWF